MKKILFTTAYSDMADKLWLYTLHLADHFEARIFLLHVYEDIASGLLPEPDVLEMEEIDNLNPFSEVQLSEEKNKLRKFVADHTPEKFQNIPKGFIVSTGDVSKAIVQETKEEHYDLIMVGMTRSNWLSDALFGSTALRLLKYTDVPVFLIPPMGSFRDINKIVYASDFGFEDLSAILHLLDWVEAFGAKLHLVHICKKETENAQATKSMEQLMQTFQDAHEAGILTFQVITGEIVQGIEKYADNIGADLIAVTPSKRSFWNKLFTPGVTERLVSEAIMPILVF